MDRAAKLPISFMRWTAGSGFFEEAPASKHADDSVMTLPGAVAALLTDPVLGRAFEVHSLVTNRFAFVQQGLIPQIGVLKLFAC